jgi:hypothetical protein
MVSVTWLGYQRKVPWDCKLPIAHLRPVTYPDPDLDAVARRLTAGTAVEVRCVHYMFRRGKLGGERSDPAKERSLDVPNVYSWHEATVLRVDGDGDGDASRRRTVTVALTHATTESKEVTLALEDVRLVE